MPTACSHVCRAVENVAQPPCAACPSQPKKSWNEASSVIGQDGTHAASLHASDASILCAQSSPAVPPVSSRHPARLISSKPFFPTTAPHCAADEGVWMQAAQGAFA